MLLSLSLPSLSFLSVISVVVEDVVVVVVVVVKGIFHGVSLGFLKYC
jgi:hypothetical protein